jgi:predicted type IV restriction endonuclease
MAIDIQKSLKKYVPFLLQAREQSLNEADTLQRIVRVFEDVLGYNIMTEITRESQIKGGYCDLALKIDGTTRLLVEVKAAGLTLRDRHIEQAERYAAEGNIRWVILTNGVHWNLYHLSFEEGIEYEKAFEVDLAADALDKAAQTLSLLHRKGISKRALEDFWDHRAALSPASIGRSLFADDVLTLIRRSIRRNEGVNIDQEDLATAIHEMLSTQSRELIGPVRIRRRRKPKPAKDVMTTKRPAEPASDNEPASDATLAE